MANGGSTDDKLGDSSEAAMSLAVESKDILELTVTKTCLDVFTKLGAVSKIVKANKTKQNKQANKEKQKKVCHVYISSTQEDISLFRLVASAVDTSFSSTNTHAN